MNDIHDKYGVMMSLDALQALEAALEQQPKDGDLAAQIGDALVSTHQYRRALDYYHKAVRNSPANLPMQLHLANLLLRLKSWDSAEKVHLQAQSVLLG